MRTFEMRVYSLRTKEALDFYASTVYPRHLNNFGLFGVEAHGLWTQKDDVAHRIFVLVSYAEGDDPGEVAQRYIQSPEAADDARGFDVADILGVEFNDPGPVSKFSAEMTKREKRLRQGLLVLIPVTSGVGAIGGPSRCWSCDSLQCRG